LVGLHACGPCSDWLPVEQASPSLGRDARSGGQASKRSPGGPSHWLINISVRKRSRGLRMAWIKGECGYSGRVFDGSRLQRVAGCAYDVWERCPDGGVPKTIGLVGLAPLGRREALYRGCFGRGLDRMRKGRVRMSSLGTGVMRDRCAPVGCVTRCVSAADTSLSLSLSLSAPDLAGKDLRRRGVVRGLRRHAARQDPSRRVARLRVAGAWGACADGC
jgi:hypothetical protein